MSFPLPASAACPYAGQRHASRSAAAIAVRRQRRRHGGRWTSFWCPEHGFFHLHRVYRATAARRRARRFTRWTATASWTA